MARVSTEGAHLECCLAEDLVGAPGRVGLISYPEACEHASGVVLLHEAVRRLRDEGANRVLGPMAGSTWGDYRLVLPDPALTQPPFTGEPWDRPDLVSIFEAAGFRPAAFYESRVVSLPARRQGAERLAARLSSRGITVREEPEPAGCLRRLYEFSRVAFADNLYYRPVPFEVFAAAQAGAARRRPLLLLAERAAELLGFAYAYDDEVVDGRLICKTLAVAPGARALGLGAHLADRLHDLAWERGYRQAIHALMHVENTSARHSLRFGGELVRRYVLFERHLR